MKDANHTPGPWILEESPINVDAVVKIGYVRRTGGHTIETNLDDARLIAAAPDLLAACEAMLRAYDVPRECCNLARDAIAKARGGE